MRALGYAIVGALLGILYRDGLLESLTRGEAWTLLLMAAIVLIVLLASRPHRHDSFCTPRNCEYWWS